LENATVKVALTKNPKIYKTAQVLFLPPVKLQIVGYNFETAVGDYIQVFVSLFAAYNDTLVPFASCENLPFDVEFSDQRLFTLERHENSEKFQDSCRSFKLRGIHPGSTNFRVSYLYGDLSFKDEVILGVFEKLSIFNPESNEIVLPIGSSRNVFYQNGPKRVFNVAAELTKTVQYNKNFVQVQEIAADRLVYQVLCKKVGETSLNLEIYNVLNQKNFIKYVSSFQTKIYCVKPRFINLYTNEKLKSSCPIESKNSLMIVNSGKDSLDIEIEVLDAENRRLDNISSLVIDWNFSQANGVVNHNIAYNREVEVDEIDGLPIPKRDFLKTSIPDQNINHKIKAIVKQYNLNILNSLSIVPETPHFGIQKNQGLVTPAIENELNFLSFDSSLLPFQRISIFLAPNIQEVIKTGHGSGFYDLKVQDPNILDAEFYKPNSELILRPKNIGSTKVRITDRCLKTEAAVLEVSVVSVGRIELATPDRVEKTKQIEAIVRLFDSDGNLLNIDWNNLENYELVEDVKNQRILQMKQGHNRNLERGEIRYLITGTELGETKIVVSSGSGNRLISSPPATVQVSAFYLVLLSLKKSTPKFLTFKLSK
jgi:nuclear pore complex protein Nup210